MKRGVVSPNSRANDRTSSQLGFAWRDYLPTCVAAFLAAGAVALLILAFDSVSVFERPVAIESLAGSIFWIASASIGSCGTIAALMLTTVSLMEHLETHRMGPRFLFHLRLTVVAAIATIGLAITALLLTTFPLAGGADVDPPSWQVNLVFFGLQGLTAAMVGGLAIVLSSLYATISDIFRNLPRGWIEDILADEAQDDASPARPRQNVEGSPRPRGLETESATAQCPEFGRDVAASQQTRKEAP